MLRGFGFALLSACCLCAAPLSAMAKSKLNGLITISAGSRGGIYDAVGNSICSLTNERTGEHGYRCTTSPSNGSEENINYVLGRRNDLGIAQQDILESYYKTAPSGKKLRFVANLYPEYVILLAKKTSGISKFDDLPGKWVNGDVIGSGTNFTFNQIMKAKGWAIDSFDPLSNNNAYEIGSAFCNTKMDAAFFVASEKSQIVERLTKLCGAEVVPMDEATIAALQKVDPIYTSGTVNGVRTVIVNATLFSSTDVKEEAVGAVVSSLTEQFDAFKKANGLSLTRQQTFLPNGAVPMHDGLKNHKPSNK